MLAYFGFKGLQKERASMPQRCLCRNLLLRQSKYIIIVEPVIFTKYTYLRVENKEVVEMFLVLSESNLLPTASIVDVCCFLQLACENPQFHTCNAHACVCISC